MDSTLLMNDNGTISYALYMELKAHFKVQCFVCLLAYRKLNSNDNLHVRDVIKPLILIFVSSV